MRKTILFGFVMLILLSPSLLALSDPINQTLTEYNNLTKADNFVEVAQEINVWVGGALGLTMLLIILMISFAMSMFFTQNVPKSLMFGMFITTFSSVLLRTVALVPDTALFYTFPMLILSVAIVIVRR